MTRAATPFDFNRDGRQELVASYADDLVILPGSASVLSRAHTVLGPPAFGLNGSVQAVASTDFNGDGFADLAASGDAVGGTPIFNPGAIGVLSGSASGLSGAPAVGVGPPQRDQDDFRTFGAALAAGDLNGDGFGDLAVGVPDDQDASRGSGYIRLIFGSASGLVWGASRILPAQPNEWGFGQLLTIADVNRDGHLDILEAAPGFADTFDESNFPGHSAYCPGTASGPRRCRQISGTRSLARNAGAPGPASLAVGDVTGDGYPDLVQGVPVDRYWEASHQEPPLPRNVVVVYRGGRHGPTGRPIVLTRATRGVPGPPRFDEQFAQAVAVQRLDRDRFADILVAGGGGQVTLIRGAASGHARNGNRIYQEGQQRFGATRITVLDRNGDHRPDLVVSRPDAFGSGAVTTRLGTRRGLASRAHTIRPGDLGLPGVKPSSDSGFGRILGNSSASSIIA